MGRTYAGHRVNTRIIGHRGSHDAARGPVENTLEAFEQAIAEGADWIELDVWRTADGALVVYHDAHLPGLSRPVAQSAQAEVRAARLPRGARVPLLSEALEVARGRVRTNVEIKHAAALDGALATMRDLHVEDDCVLSSFDHSAMFEAADRDSRVERALIMGEDAPTVRQTLREVWPFWALQRAGARYWHTHGRNAAEPVVHVLLRQGVETQVWTVNDEERATQLIARGVAGLFTDRPGAMRTGLAARSASGRA